MKKIVVIGAGTMGLDIAQVFAKKGFDVVVRDISDEIVQKAEARLNKTLDKQVAKGKLDEAGKAAIVGKMTFTTDLAKAAEYRKVDHRWCTDSNVRPGDAIIVSGYVGDHGIALLSFREGYGFDSEVQSDVAPLNKMIAKGLAAGGIVAMKDPTRGGLANTLNEWCSKSHVGMEIDYPSIPLRDGVVNACELLGIDPLAIGNEGKCVIGVVPEMADEVLKAIRSTPEGKDAAIIGHAVDGPERVVLRTEVGGRRILEPPAGDPVPRIC